MRVCITDVRHRPRRPTTVIDGSCTFDFCGSDPAIIEVFPRDVGGVATVLVTALDQTETVQITFHGAVTAATAELSQTRISDGAGDATAELTITVTDANGVPVKGHDADIRCHLAGC